MYCKIHLLEITGWFQIPSALTREDKNSVLRSKYKKTRATPMQPTAVTVRADWRETRDESETHRVGRVLSFSPVVGIGTPPTPHPQASVPIPLGSGGRGTLAGESGWESPNSDEGTYTVVLFTQFVTVNMFCRH